LGFLKNSRDIIVFALHCGVQEEKCRGAGRNCPTKVDILRRSTRPK